MKNFARHTHKIHTHKIQLTALSAGEAAQSSIHASNASKMNKTKTYSSRYDFLNEDLPCLDCYFHANEVANPVADYPPSDNAMLLHTRLGHASKRTMIWCLKQGINMGVNITLDELIHANIYCKA